MNAPTPVMVTGHRDLPTDDWQWVQAEFRRCLAKLEGERGPLVAIQGLALGADMLFGETALALTIPVISYLPFPGQPDRWPDREKRRHAALMAASESVIRVVDEPISDRSSVVRALHGRNDAMIRDSKIVVGVLDGRRTGGTYTAVKKAIAKEREVLRINPAARTTNWIRSIR